MDPRWQRIEQIFNAAVELPKADHEAFLERACAGDPDLRRQVESLLSHDDTGDAFVEVAVAAAALEDSSLSGVATEAGLTPPAVQIGPYRIVREIGSGGMGVLYEAIREDQFQKRVALKIVKRGMDTASIVRRFHRERQILAGLNHPNITALLDGGTTPDGRPYFVMEYVEGKPIGEYCDAHKLSTRERLELFRPVCAAVHYAHQNLVVHRDLKPGNILVTREGVPKLLDFGIAKILNLGVTAGTMDLTEASMRLMTPEYASPEQVRGEPITTSSDVYSLGALLYELLTGHRPHRFKTRTPQDIAHAICEQQPERPSTAITRVEETVTPEAVSATRDGQPEQLRKRLRGDVDNIVLKALHKEAGRRYSSVEQFSEDIRRHLTGLPVMARNDTVAYRAGKFVRRHKLGVLSAAAVALALIAGVVVSSWMAVRASRAEQEARAVNDFLQNDLLAQAGAFRQAHPEPDLRVRTALDRAAARIGGKFGGQPLVEASIRQTIGNAYLELGLYAPAAQQLERALELRRRLLGERHPETLASMSTLVAIYVGQGSYAQAEQLAMKALAGRHPVRGREDPNTLRSMSDLGWVYYLQGKYAEAEPLQAQALEGDRRVWGEENPETLDVMRSLATTYAHLGKYAQAEPLHRRALEVRLRVSGEEHPETLQAMNDLGSAYLNQGKYSQAEPLYAKALEVRRRTLGAEHPRTLQSMTNMAVLYRAQGKYAQAEQLDLQTLEVRRRISGGQHLSTLILMNNLAELYRNEGKYAQAEALFDESLAAGRRSLGEKHEATLDSMKGLADIYGNRGRYVQAEALYAKTLELQRQALGDGHPDTLDTSASLARLRMQQKRYTEAETALRSDLQIYDKARSDAWQRSSCDSMLGASLAGQKRFAEAEPLLISGYQGMIQREATISAPDRTNLRDAGERIVQLYQDWGKPDKASEWQAKLKSRSVAVGANR